MLVEPSRLHETEAMQKKLETSDLKIFTIICS